MLNFHGAYNYLHWDLKPPNVVIDKDECPLLIDVVLAVPFNSTLDNRGSVTHKVDHWWFPQRSMRWGWWTDCFGSTVLTCQILGVFIPRLYEKPQLFNSQFSRIVADWPMLSVLRGQRHKQVSNLVL